MKVLSALVAAAVAAVVTLGPAPAGAEPPVPTQSADGSVCGEVTLSGTPGSLPGDYLLHWFVEDDTENASNFHLPGDKVVTFDEDYGDGEISVVFFMTGPESDTEPLPQAEEVTVDTDCAEPTEPTVPTTPTTEPTAPTTEPPATDPTVPTTEPTGAPVAPPASPVVAQPRFTG